MKLLAASLLTVCSLVALADAVDYERQAITIAMTQEPPTLDSTRATDTISAFALGHSVEGLVAYDRRGRITAGVAESWEIEADRMVFRLRDNSTWSNGTPVTAHDFVYAWQRINDPAVAAPFAAIMHPILNAAEAQRGEVPPSSLGVRAIDDRTLEVRLAGPCGYCLGLMAHTTFLPINEAFHRQVGEAYGADADKLITNGPFTIDAWVHSASMKFSRNPDYWAADRIKLNEINVGYITEDNRSRLNLFRDGEIALVRLGAETVKDAADQGLRIRTFLSGGVSYLTINQREGKVGSDVRVRRAISLAFDGDAYVNRVIGIPGYRATSTFFPAWLQGVEGKFVDEFPPAPAEYDPGKARALIEEVRQEGKLAPITLLTVASPTGRKIAEYLQGVLQGNLGMDVRVDQQTLKQYLEKSRGGQFDVGLASWYPDFDDIVTYADLLVSWNPNNRGGYVNPVYDETFRILQGSMDAQERYQAAAELQRIIQVDVPVIPMAETGSAYVQHPKLRGAIRRVMAQDPDYRFAEVLP